VGNKVRDSDILSWYDLQNPDARGLAAPVKSLLENLKGERHDSHG
jgi:hypothetical protein